jgi:hypothetical protein
MHQIHQSIYSLLVEVVVEELFAEVAVARGARVEQRSSLIPTSLLSLDRTQLLLVLVVQELEELEHP